MAPDRCLECLKSIVLKKGNMLLTSYNDARDLATIINVYTSHYIAEIAVLRTYGFVTAKFPPSQYTKDVLAKFCGYQDYAKFCEHESV